MIYLISQRTPTRLTRKADASQNGIRYRSSVRWLIPLLLLALLAATPVRAQRRIEVRFRPTRRAQIAMWMEDEAGTRFQTIRLTEATAYRGLDNRPGALQMNSGFHWPYGRREGALPIWASRRAEVSGTAFRRVVFNGRASEGHASVSGAEPGNTRDAYYCLSFSRDLSDRAALDAMTCASVFFSNKGRYLTESDFRTGYGEPWEEGAMARMRPLSLTSLYPPRRDIAVCEGICGDAPEVAQYTRDALAVMPDLDTVSMATPTGTSEELIDFALPRAWPDGNYVVRIEVNVEGDYAPGWDDTARPTPHGPSGSWDSWAESYGYAYRGQPSVLYEIPVRIDAAGTLASTRAPVGYGDIHGATGNVTPIDATIVDDPSGASGSGADRLITNASGIRASVTVPESDPCARPDAPPECGVECGPSQACGVGLACSPEGSCVAECVIAYDFPAPTEVTLSPYHETRHQHQWGELTFAVPALARSLRGFEVRIGTQPITDETSFFAARPARAASIDDIALTVPATQEDGSPLEAGDIVSVNFGGLNPETHYWLGIRVRDACGRAGEIAVAEFETTEVHFTTVSPCFVATAAYGSPLDARIGVLRRFRDRQLENNALGRSLVDAYETFGPVLADQIRESEDARALVRAMLTPVIAMLEATN